MIGKNIIIKFDGEFASLYDGHTVVIDKLFAKDLFLSGLVATRPCHLQVVIKKYAKNELSVRIESYNVGSGTFTYSQNENTHLLGKIATVNLIDGSNTMSLYGMGLKNSPSKNPKLDYDNEGLIKEVPKPPEKQSVISNKLEKPKVEKRQISLNISHPIEKLTFDNNCVFFEYEIPKLDKTVDIIIDNDFIDPVHDSIKPYFSKVLNLKNINVDITIEYTEDTRSHSSIRTVTNVEAHSTDIDRITPDLIERVKYRYLKNKIRSDNSNEKSLLTREEFLQLNENNKDVSELYESDEALLEALTKVTKTKHHEHLLFLSEIHDHNTMKLRFISRPTSFMFLINGDLKDYFVWETSDTKEATYIWSISRNHTEDRKSDLRKKLDEIDSIVSTVINEGKNQYIKKSEENFIRIRHNYTESLGGFNSWKTELLDTIV